MRWPRRITFISLLSLFLIPPAQGRVKYNYSVQVRSQLGSFLREPLTEVATNRLMIDMAQMFDSGAALSGKASARVRADGAYANNPDVYSTDQARKESSEISIRDTFLQAKGGGFSARLGFQQVVWGEAFGFFYADIINPKDLREFILTGLFEQSDLRTPIPLANLQWMGSDTTVQLLYGPMAVKHKLPVPTSSFFPFEFTQFGLNNSQVSINTDAKLDDSAGDYGARLSQRFGNLDMSVIGLRYLDRMPYYEVSSFIPFSSLTLRERQNQVTTAGLTATFEADEWLWRLEFINTTDRRLNVLSGTTLSAREFTERTAVVGVDFPTLGNWSLSVQVSGTQLSPVNHNLKPIGRKNDEGVGSIRIGRNFENHGLELLHSTILQDRSSLTSLKWNFGRSSRLEYLLGVETMQGSGTSTFGAQQSMSRIMVGLKGIFDG